MTPTEPHAPGRTTISPPRRLFTTRRGGVSTGAYDSGNLGLHVGDDPARVRENRSRVAARAGLALADLVFMDQVHGTTVGRIDGRQSGPLPDTDAVITTVRGLALAVLVADCVPILAADPVAGVIAAAHAGRVGAAGGILAAVVSAMTTAGARLDRLDVVLGPAICGACYEVPADMRDEVEAALPGSASRTRIGTPGLDLRAGLLAWLQAAGVATATVDPRCTLEDPDLFSHRRGAPTGRQAGIIWMPGPGVSQPEPPLSHR